MTDKKTLIVIIVLLVVLTPFTILGTMKHFKNDTKKVIDNPEKLEIYNNTVFFYNNSNLLKTYECTSECSKAINNVEENSYHTNIYVSKINEIPTVLNEYWGIFSQDKKVAIYNLVGGSIAQEYDAVKYLSDKETNLSLIAKKNDKWGLIYLDMGSNKGLPYEYDYISMPAHFKDGNLNTLNSIGLKDNVWNVYDKDGNIIATSSEEIVDFNDISYVTYGSGRYHVYDFEGNEHFSYMAKDKVYAFKNYTFIITNNVLYVYKDLNETVISNYNLEKYDDIYFNENGEKTEIYVDGKIFQTLS